ncbi:hypothetical protein [Shigella flexneri]
MAHVVATCVTDNNGAYVIEAGAGVLRGCASL